MKYYEIQKYIEKRLVSEQKHPEDPDVRIFNYTQTCQFLGAWDEITAQCRGLIMNIKTGEIIARPFPKFFNYQEHIAKGKSIPEEDPIITEKLDGSLGILYELNGKPWIATRGSFTSEQAIWATKWYRENMAWFTYPKSATYLFEIIYPENRIVVNYNFSGLVLLAAIDKETGQDTFPGFDTLVQRAKTVDSRDLVEILKMDEPNSEGFVLYYPKENLRLKIKFPEYVRLHRIVTGVSEIAIWEMLRDGKNIEELLDKVPDEFYKWVDGVQMKLRAEFAGLWGKAQLAAQMVHGMKTRKEQALWIMENKKDVSGIIFSLLDGKDREAVLGVWRIIRPRGQSVFKNDIDL